MILLDKNQQYCWPKSQSLLLLNRFFKNLINPDSTSSLNQRTVPGKSTLNFYRHKVQTVNNYPLPSPIRHSTLPQYLLDRLETIQNLEKITYNQEMDHEENRRKKKREVEREVIQQNDLVLPLSNTFIEDFNKVHYCGEDANGSGNVPDKDNSGQAIFQTVSNSVNGMEARQVDYSDVWPANQVGYQKK